MAKIKKKRIRLKVYTGRNTTVIIFRILDNDNNTKFIMCNDTMVATSNYGFIHQGQLKIKLLKMLTTSIF